MKKLLFFLLFLNSFYFIGQEDRMNFNLDLSFGNVKYEYNQIENSGHSFSNQAWYDTVHSTSFSKVHYTYKGLNALVNFGIHVPVWNNGVLSAGIRPKLGGGRLFQIDPSPGNVVDQYGWAIENDSKRISSMSYAVELNGYFRYNMGKNRSSEHHALLLLGYRFLNSHDKIRTPTIGLEIGAESWSFGLYSHLYRFNYYRIFSDGSREISKSSHEFGFKINFFFDSALF